METGSWVSVCIIFPLGRNDWNVAFFWDVNPPFSDVCRLVDWRQGKRTLLHHLTRPGPAVRKVFSKLLRVRVKNCQPDRWQMSAFVWCAVALSTEQSDIRKGQLTPWACVWLDWLYPRKVIIPVLVHPKPCLDLLQSTHTSHFSSLTTLTSAAAVKLTPLTGMGLILLNLR